jgi:hypothetical protein
VRQLFSRGVVLFAGLLTSTGAANSALPMEQENFTADPRIERLKAFFDRNHCPVADLTKDFITAADQHSLDWRLLPSIALVESGGGRKFAKNNIFGWDSARRGFPSIRAGIHIVAARLATSRLYKGKRLRALLATYNPRAEYATLVQSIMHRLGPANFANAAPQFATVAQSSMRIP